MSEASLQKSLGAFALVGLAATLIHYAALWTLVERFHLPFIGLANTLAAIVGISSSYWGNRVFVFPTGQRTVETLPRFFLAYGVMLLLHSVLMTVWADILAMSYTIGFILITGLTAALNYLANRLLVFRRF